MDSRQQPTRGPSAPPPPPPLSTSSSSHSQQSQRSQHPFPTRNDPSPPFARNPYQPPDARSPPPPSSASATYGDHQLSAQHSQHLHHLPHQQQHSVHRRGPSDSSYYTQPRPSYATHPPNSNEAVPPSTKSPLDTAPNHSRNPSGPALSSASAMPQHAASPPPAMQSLPSSGAGGPLPSVNHASYTLPHPRVVSTSAFPSMRELPSLSSLPRVSSSGSSMSISSMLGGPSIAHARESTGPSQYVPPIQQPPSASPPVSGPPSAYGSSIHASPRIHTVANDFSPYRRPQTPPEHQRPFNARDSRDPRDQRDTREPNESRNVRGQSIAMSPKQGMYASTPELPRYGTPQSYAQPQRGPPPSSDQQARMGAGISRPNSQPMSYLPGPPGSSAREKQHNGPTPPHAEQYGHREDAPSRHPPGYSPDQRSHLYKYEEQHAPHPQHQPLPYLSDRERERERELEWEQRERQSREMEMKDRERRERANTGASDPGSSLPDLRTADYRHPQQGAPPLQHQLHSYGRQPDSRDSRELRDPRDHAAWPPRPGYEQSRPYDPGRPNDYHPSNNQPPPPPPPPPSQYSIHGPPASATQDRYHPTSLPPTHHMVSGGPSPYESSDHSRTGLVHSSEVPRRAPAGLTTSYPESRAGVQNQQLQQGPLQHGGAPGRPRPTDEAPLPPSVAYSGSAGGSGGPAPGSYDGQPSRQRSSEDAAAYPPRNLLAIQEINRRGRVSPMPQAVQGAQPQMHGPTGEPSIKSEFGRMYMGIGNGVGMGLSSPITSGASLPFSNGGPGGHTAALRRESADNMGLDASSDPQAKPAKGKRRKALKDEPGKVLSADDNGSGRVTPSSKPKRAKTAHHHHHHHHPAHHHHHHPDTSSTLVTALPSLKTGKGATPIPLPPSVGGPPRDFVTAQFSQAASRPAIQPPLRVSSPQQAEHGQLLLPTKRTTNGTLAPIQAAPAVIKPKQIILSQAVVDSVADQPRNYLGDVLYEPKLKAARKCDPLTGRPPRYPYSTTPRPLPLDMIKDKANSVLTVKISKVFLQRAPREEITYRRALWGTDIYTDDSDVIAACIHGGWIRGEWPDDVDVDLLSLSEQADASGSNNTRETAGGRKRSTAATATAAAATAVAETRVEPIPDELTAPPRTGPMEIPPEKDLHVTLVILPTLLKYSATTRFGIRSREWGGQPHQQHQMHDGMSFKVLKLRWVTNGAGAQSRLRGKARRERMRQAMREVELASSVGKNELPQISAPLVFSGDDDGDASNGVLKQCYQPLPRKFVAQDAGAVGDGDKENRPGPAELADATISLKEDLVASSRPQADTAVIDSLVASDAGVAALSAMSEAAAVAAAAAAEDPDTTMTDAGADD